MTTLRETVEQALEALENLQPIIGNGLLDKRQLAFIDPHLDIAITALRAALAQQAEPVEPVAQYSDIVSDGGMDPRNKYDTAPPQRKPLTEEEIVRIAREAGLGWDEKYHWYVGSESLVRFARLIHTRGQA